MKNLFLICFFALLNTLVFSQPAHTLSMFMDIDANGNSIYVSTLGFGVLKSTNSGNTWFLASTGIEGKDIRSLDISPTNPSELVATVWDNCCPVGGFLGVYKSTNGGDNWFSISSGLSGDLAPIAYDPSNSNTIYVAGYFGNFYKSTNGGANWTIVSGVFGDINSLHVQSNGTVWAGGWGGLRKSTNGGTNWQTMPGIPSGNVIYIESIGSDLNTIYVTVNPSGETRLIYKTTNGGSSWAQIGQSIGGGNILALVNDPNTVFVGNKKGCYKTTDGGANWTVVDTSIVLSANSGSIANGNLYLASGGGVYELDNVIPVELISFTAELIDNDILIQWVTASETNNWGFEIQKKIEGEFIRVEFINGAGTTTNNQFYSYLDTRVLAGIHTYRLMQIDYDGSVDYSKILEIEVNGSYGYALGQNYPNPFNPTTKISYSLPQSEMVSLKILNVLGQEIISLVNEEKPAGYYEVDFNAAYLPSGIYMYRIQAGSFAETKKMILLR